MTFTFVNIGFASWPGKSLRAITSEWTGCIDANTVVFTRWSLITFINIFGTIDSFVARCTRTRVWSIDWAGITNGIWMAWIRCASIIQMTQKTRFARNATTIKCTNSINTGSTVETCCTSTIVYIFTAICTSPTIYTDARVTAVCIRASGTILANRRSHQAFVNVIFTVFARIMRWTFTTIRIHTVDTLSTVLTKISRTIVDILFTIDALKTCEKEKSKERKKNEIYLKTYFSIEIKWWLFIRRKLKYANLIKKGHKNQKQTFFLRFHLRLLFFLYQSKFSWIRSTINHDIFFFFKKTFRQRPISQNLWWSAASLFGIATIETKIDDQ